MTSFLLSCSTFRSVKYAVKLIRSLDLLGSDCHLNITGPDLDELSEILNQVGNDPRVTLYHSGLDSHHFCRNWGFVVEAASGRNYDWYIGCDDDVEFTEDSKEIESRLKSAWEDRPFSLMGFNNPAQVYQKMFEWCFKKNVDQTQTLLLHPKWLDGNLVFCRFVDAKYVFGIEDGPDPSVPVCPCMDIEYGHRAKYLSGRPIVVDVTKNFYVHHFRNDPEKHKIRDPMITKGYMEESGKFWKDKFGVEGFNFMDPNVHQWLYDNTMGAGKFNPNYLVFRGLSSWDRIYKVFFNYIQEVR